MYHSEITSQIIPLNYNMAYILFLALSLQTTQHTLGEVYIKKERANNRCGYPIVSFAAWKPETSNLSDSLSDLSRPLLRYIGYAVFCAPKHEHHY
jgi:hypothetical protein